MRKILFVCNRLGGGGSERVLTLIANSLSEDADNDVHILSLGKTDDKYDINDCVTVDQPQKNANGRLAAIKDICFEIKSFGPSIIISFEYQINLKTIIAAILERYNGRLIVSERNDPNQRGGYFPIKQLRDILYSKADRLVCQTPDAKAYFKKHVQKKSVVIPNPIKDDLPKPWDGEREHVIVNFCRLVKQKNIPLLIEAFASFQQKHQDYKLLIYGDGEERDNIASYISSKNLEDSVILHHADKDVHKMIVKSAMFVSSSDYEGLSNSMLEAMAMGIPTICTDCPCGGARMVIRDGENGLLVPVGHAAELASAMAYVADDASVMHRFSENGRKIGTAFSRGDIVAMWREIISA